MTTKDEGERGSQRQHARRNPPRVNHLVEYFWPAGAAKGWCEVRHCGLDDEGVGVLLGDDGARAEMHGMLLADLQWRLADCNFYLRPC